MVKELKKSIDPFKGLDVTDDGYRTGRLKILRRSLTDVLEHCDPHDANLLGWLADFSPDDMKGWTYEGWAANRPIAPGGKGYDPARPDKRKHPETEYFLYYSKEIGGRKYWANVKMHKMYGGEVLYAIFATKPNEI